MFAAALLACAHAPEPPAPSLDEVEWNADPRRVFGDIRVAPPIVGVPAPEVDLKGLLGEPLDNARAARRITRTAELAELPYVVQSQVPGALNAALGDDWSGHFRDARLSPAQNAALVAAVQGRASLEHTLAGVAPALGGDAALFTWISALEAKVLTRTHLIGELAVVHGTPVMVDHQNEPYDVVATLGIALVACDGQLVFRWEDDYALLLTEGLALEVVGRDLAEQMVADVTPLWLDLEQPEFFAEEWEVDVEEPVSASGRPQLEPVALRAP